MSRMNSFSWGASASQPSRNSRKRPSQPSCSPPMAKRSKSGPFMIETDSEGERRSDEDSDNGFNFDDHITVTPNAVRTERELQSSFSYKSDVLPSSVTVQQYQSVSTPGKQQTDTKLAMLPRVGKSLNKDRLQLMIAKTPGGVAKQGLPQGVAPNGLHTRPMNGARMDGLIQKKPSAAAMNADVSLSHETRRCSTYLGPTRIYQQSVRSMSPSVVEVIPQPSKLGYSAQHNLPNIFNKSTNQQKLDNFYESRRQQKPTLSNESQQPPTRAIKQGNSSIHPTNSSISRSKAVRFNITANSSSLRNALEAKNIERYSAPKVQNNVGSEWRRAQAELGSAKNINNARRPDPGARYRHTLSTLKASAVEVPASTKEASASTAAKGRKPSGVTSQVPTGTLSPGYTKSEATSPHITTSSHSVHTLDQPLVSHVAKLMDPCNPMQLIGASKPSGSSSRTETNVPVAVMVRPAQTHHTDAAQSPNAALSGTGAEYLASPSPTNEKNRAVVIEIKAPGSGSSFVTGLEEMVGIAGDDEVVSESTGNAHAEQAAFSAPAESANIHVSSQLLEGPSQRRSFEYLEPIKTATAQPAVTVPLEAVVGVSKQLQSSGSSLSGANSEIIVAEPFNLSLPEFDQANLNAQLPPSPSSTEPLLPQPTLAPKVLTNSQTSSIAETTATPQSSKLTSAMDIVLPSSSISPTAEPYFEYTIHQAFATSSGELETKVSAHPLTSFHVAHAQMKRSLETTQQQLEMLGMQFVSAVGQSDSGGLPVHHITLESHEDPSQKCTLKLWIQRAQVGVHANHTPSPTFAPPSVRKNVYAVRIWKLLTLADDDDKDGEGDENESQGDYKGEQDGDGEDDSKDTGKSSRVYYPFPHICNEIHTTLSAANRAAKRIQIHMSHVKDPRSLQKQWQMADLQKMERKLEDLRKEAEEGDGDEEDDTPSLSGHEYGRRRGCWRSVFREPMEDVKDADARSKVETYEVLVCRVALSGPRNL